jgi:hypothetical protein
MIMGNFRAFFGFHQHIINGVTIPSNRAYLHGRAVSIDIVRLGIIGINPFSKAAAISPMRIYPAKSMIRLCVITVMQERMHGAMVRTVPLVNNSKFVDLTLLNS